MEIRVIVSGEICGSISGQTLWRNYITRPSDILKSVSEEVLTRILSLDSLKKYLRVSVRLAEVDWKKPGRIVKKSFQECLGDFHHISLDKILIEILEELQDEIFEGVLGKFTGLVHRRILDNPF